MAPNKKKVPSKSRAKAAKKHDSNDRVVKRSGRGYHRFRNGMLNVTPKGAEIELVKQNQNKSPLLRLPPELRSQIWAYVVGGDTLNPLQMTRRRLSWMPELIRPSLALLRTCRQIYAETCQVPFSLNTFRFDPPLCMRAWLNGLKRYQRSQMSSLEYTVYLRAGLQLQTRRGLKNAASIPYNPLGVDSLPGLKHISILLRPLFPGPDTWYEDMTRLVEQQLEGLLAGREVDVVFERQSRD